MFWLLFSILASALANHQPGEVVNVVRRSGSAGRPARPLIYRSQDGSSDFGFEFVLLAPGDIRIYILDQPQLGRGSCHVLHDSAGPYVCWSGPIPTLRAAKGVAAEWAERTLVYWRTGRVF